MFILIVYFIPTIDQQDNMDYLVIEIKHLIEIDINYKNCLKWFHWMWNSFLF